MSHTDDPGVALGAMYLGTRLDQQASFDLLDAYVDLGGTWIDTANCYSFWQSETGAGGQSEETIGRWLAARPGMRERVSIGTKVGVEPRVAGRFDELEGLAPEVVRAGIEASLRRLGTDHVELFWAHGEDRSVDFTASLGAFSDVARDGLAERIGLSNHPSWLVERAQHLLAAADGPRVTAVQQRTSYLHHRPDVAVDGSDHEFGMMTPEGVDYSRRNPDVELWGYTALLLGAYDRDDRSPGEAYDHPGTTRRLAVLTEVAKELDVARGQVVLAWLVGGEVPVRPIVGGSTVAQLESAMAGARLTLDAELRDRLDAAG